MMPSRVSMRLGFWISSILAALGVLYLAILIGHFASNGFADPPTPLVQIAGGLATILTAPAILILFAVIADLAPKDKSVYGTIGLSFSILFVAMVTINRFVQLTIIRMSPPAAQATDLARFLPYSSESVMFALEILGWGLFLSIACVFIAPLFWGPMLQRAIRWLLVAFGLFSLTSVAGFATATPITALAFVAWGPILLAISVLLAIMFRRGLPLSTDE